MKTLIHWIIVMLGLLFLWESIILFFNLPPYILPTPYNVLLAWYTHFHLIKTEAITTIIETLLGLSLGILVGIATALIMAFSRPFMLWLLPILLISQVIPTFAIAPLLVIWLGYGMSSKITTTAIMLFFPITSAFFDGLRYTHPDLLDLARTMNAKKWRLFWHIRIPAALPHLASGLRIAVIAAPISAVIGEWVGASHGLGFLILNANARMQIDLMFAALATLTLLSLFLYYLTTTFLKKMIPWQNEAKPL